MSDSEKEKSILKMLLQLWEIFINEVDFKQLSLKAQEIIDDLLQKLPEIELDNDMRNKEEVYVTIANFLHEKLSQPLQSCLSTALILCEETDEHLLKKYGGYDTNTRLVENAKRLILSIKVYYEPLSDRSYDRITEIYFVKGSQTSVTKVKEELEWDRLPGDVRESRLRQGEEKQIFKLYPREG